MNQDRTLEHTIKLTDLLSKDDDGMGLSFENLLQSQRYPTSGFLIMFSVFS